jgi:hypothetical protein
VTTLEYASAPTERRVSPQVALTGVIVSVICTALGIWLTLRLTPTLIEWPGHNSVRYRQLSDQFYFVALPLCAAPLAGWYVASRARTCAALSRALVWASALVWLVCWMYVR